jgi:hypothetical protein
MQRLNKLSKKPTRSFVVVALVGVIVVVITVVVITHVVVVVGVVGLRCVLVEPHRVAALLQRDAEQTARVRHPLVLRAA